MKEKILKIIKDHRRVDSVGFDRSENKVVYKPFIYDRDFEELAEDIARLVEIEILNRMSNVSIENCYVINTPTDEGRGSW